MKTAKTIKGKLLHFFLLLLGSNCLAAEGMPQFNAKSFNSQLFWLALTFATLYFIVTYLILPRIRENIRLRKNKIANDLERAESIKIEVENMLSQSKVKFEESRNLAKKIIKDSLIRSNKEYNNQIETIKKQITNKQLETEKKIAEFKNNIKKDTEKSIVYLSAVILSKLNYKNSSPKEIEEELLKFKMRNNV